jgi:chorismate mutase
VVAMQYEITDTAAIEFSSAFYEALADSLPVDAAVTEARTAVSMDSMLEWGTPVLYMHSPDGRVFDMFASSPRAHPTPETEERREEDPLRRYREGVESAWAGGELDVRRAERLRDLADELEITPSSVANLEREIMGNTVEEILERYEQAAREEDRRNHLDELYGRARRLHQDQDWQAVVGLFEEIHAEDPDYPDTEGLLQSAREALERIQKEQETIRRYREAVEWAWADEDLDRRYVKRLRDLANRLGLNPNTATQIEREIMGETKEMLLSRQEQSSAEQYRKAVEEAWTDNQLSNAEAKWLGALVSELGLTTDTAADIEREIMDDTITAIIQRQHRLDELYTQARQSHKAQEWQTVVDLFERIHSDDPRFPDPEELLASAHEALDRARKIADLYDQGLRYVDGNERQQALECFEEVQRLEPGYRDTEELLSRLHQELAPPPMAKVPDLVGQEVSQASSALTSEGLTLDAQRKAPSDTVLEGQIIEQSPVAGTEVRPGTPVSVTISSGPSTARVPDLTGKGRDEEGATEVRQTASLSLGDQSFFDELTRVCAKYTGLSYYVNEAIPRQNLAIARRSIPIPTGERVIALVDNSSVLSSGIGLAVCGDGIRWRNYAENPVSKETRGFLGWSEFADVTLREHQWAAEYGIEMGRDNVFVAWKNDTMDQHTLVKLLEDIQALIQTSEKEPSERRRKPEKPRDLPD